MMSFVSISFVRISKSLVTLLFDMLAFKKN
jgi:hypothetical protein